MPQGCIVAQLKAMERAVRKLEVLSFAALLLFGAWVGHFTEMFWIIFPLAVFVTLPFICLAIIEWFIGTGEADGYWGHG